MVDKKKFLWSLNDNNFSWWDRFHLAKFFLNKDNQWTQGKKVKEFERKMAEFTNNKYAVFVSSGSTANTLLSMYLKSVSPKGKVIFPSTTWATSINPFIREGFDPVFLDITLDDLSLDLNLLENYLKQNSDVVAVFVTSLLGISPNISRLKKIEQQYPKIKFWMDNCEANMTNSGDKNVSSYFTSTTSTYFSHQIFSVEGGFVLTNDKDIYEYCVLARSHGLTRALPEKTGISNSLVDSQFDFYLLGNNFRNTDINATIGLLDFKKAEEHRRERKKLYRAFCNALRSEVFITYPVDNAMFSLPIILNPKYATTELFRSAKDYCELNQIEYRPVVSGNLLRQTCFKSYGNYFDYPVSEFVNNFGFYVGLHPAVDMGDIIDLAIFLNSLS